MLVPIWSWFLIGADNYDYDDDTERPCLKTGNALIIV